MISLIDRYIGRMFFVFFIGALVVFVSLFLAVDFLTSLNRFDANADVLLNYYQYLLPSIVYQMTPVACMVATVFTISSLNTSNELTILFSCGMSLARVSLPILTLVTLISGFSYWMSDRVLPSFAQKKNYIYYVEIKKKPSLYSTVKTDKIWYRSRNVLFNIQTLLAAAKRAQGVSIYYFDNVCRLVQVIKAEEVLLNGQEWHLKKGSVTVFAQESSFPLTKIFSEKTVQMDEDVGDLSSTGSSADILSVNQLSQFIKKNKDAGLDTTRYEMDLYTKFSFAFSALVMSLIGIPFSLVKARSGGKLLSTGICIGITFLYWTLYNSFITMGNLSYFPPIVSAWLPNLMTGILAMIFLMRMGK